MRLRLETFCKLYVKSEIFNFERNLEAQYGCTEPAEGLGSIMFVNAWKAKPLIALDARRSY